MCARKLLSLVAAGAAVFGLAAGAATGASTPGNVAKGKALFLRQGLFCGSCHILKAAGSRGRSGPDLDKAKLSYAAIVTAVGKGTNPSKKWPTGMPGYGKAGELNKAEIRDIAAFVYTATHK